MSVSRHSAAPTFARHMPAIEIGLGGTEAGNLFIAGRPASQIGKQVQRLDTAETVMLVGAIVLVAVVINVITNLNSLDDGETE
jgi:hypothetical protein